MGGKLSCLDPVRICLVQEMADCSTANAGLNVLLVIVPVSVQCKLTCENVSGLTRITVDTPQCEGKFAFVGFHLCVASTFKIV